MLTKLVQECTFQPLSLLIINIPIALISAPHCGSTYSHMSAVFFSKMPTSSEVS
jgi:hypothetical protein